MLIRKFAGYSEREESIRDTCSRDPALMIKKMQINTSVTTWLISSREMTRRKADAPKIIFTLCRSEPDTSSSWFKKTYFGWSWSYMWTCYVSSAVVYERMYLLVCGGIILNIDSTTEMTLWNYGSLITKNKHNIYYDWLVTSAITHFLTS